MALNLSLPTPMPQRSNTVVPKQQKALLLPTAVVLLLALLTSFSLLALFMVRNHAWTDRLMAGLPGPGPASSLAADPSLNGQLRMTNSSAWVVHLKDRTRAVVAETVVINESLITVRGDVIVEATTFSSGAMVNRASTPCGKAISRTLLERLPKEAVKVLGSLDNPSPTILRPGDSVRCQVTFVRPREEIDEVSLRIASVEPLPDHPPRSFLDRE
ncbi:MAG: hypothetical protein VCA74_07435 [Deltaproteobacteria bacterium]